MSTLRGWWEEDHGVTQIFFNRELGQAGPAPAHCDPWINKAIVVQHLQSPAMWSLFQLQDLLGMDAALRRPDPAAERINVPGNPRNVWRYRMHLSLEQLGREDAFNKGLREMIAKAAGWVRNASRLLSQISNLRCAASPAPQNPKTPNFHLLLRSNNYISCNRTTKQSRTLKRPSRVTKLIFILLATETKAHLDANFPSPETHSGHAEVKYLNLTFLASDSLRLRWRE